MIIIDDFLCDDYLSHIQDIIPNLGYEPHSSLPENPNSNFFVSIGDFQRTDAFNYMFKKIQNLPYIKKSSAIRIYVNLHPSGEVHGGDFHMDDGTITALFYPMPWDRKCGGGTEFKDKTVVEYKMNRLVLFDAYKLHRGIEHTNSDMFRYTVAFKMNAEWV